MPAVFFGSFFGAILDPKTWFDFLGSPGKANAKSVERMHCLGASWIGWSLLAFLRWLSLTKGLGGRRGREEGEGTKEWGNAGASFFFPLDLLQSGRIPNYDMHFFLSSLSICLS